MAIDTVAKRNSVLSVNSYILPIPDGTIAQDDRQTLLRVYGGILAGAAAAALGKLHDRLSITINHLGL